jgi:antitoxin MazE
MKTRLVRKGRSYGIRLPKTLLAKAQLVDEVKIVAFNDRIVISPVRNPRAGWAEAAKLAHARGEDKLSDPMTSTHFDKQWRW